jgi:hypothetical protein
MNDLPPVGMPFACCLKDRETEWAPMRAASSRWLKPLFAQSWTREAWSEPLPKAWGRVPAGAGPEASFRPMTCVFVVNFRC